MMNDIDRRLLTEVQREFPCVHRPYLHLSELVNISETEVIERLRDLSKNRYLRQISAIFDTESLGYQSSLVAMEFLPDKLEEAAKVINYHPGVSHNYKRESVFNLWFTIAVPPHHSLEKTIECLGKLSGALRTRILPTLTLYKIGVKLNLDQTESNTLDSQNEIYDESKKRRKPVDLNSLEKMTICALQENIPFDEIPFEELAKRIGTSEESLFQMIKKFKEEGYMRRFAAILYHRNAGFNANAMVVWQIPEGKHNEIGGQMARFPQVSHCYKRPLYPDWPYSLYCMIHGQKEEDCEKVVQKIVSVVGDWPRKSIYSTKEYKKTRLKFFTPDYDQWYEKYMKAPRSL